MDGLLINKTVTILIACPGGKTDITIPQKVTRIGNYAFEGCDLTSINIPEGVTSIGDNAFQYCTSLTSITIPESLTYIGNEAFLRCSKLTSITITQGVTRIGDGAFYDCSGLSSITFNSATTEIYDSEYTIPAATKIIGYNPSIAKDYAATYGRTFESLGSPPDYTTEGCFIATAAFGSKFYWPVALLRDFRDHYLLTNSLGTAFVKFYYQNSPPIAVIIATSQPLKILVRVLLVPIIAGVYLIYHPALLVAFLLLFIALFAVRRSMLRRRCV